MPRDNGLLIRFVTDVQSIQTIVGYS
jgi:hypothetical protein